MVGERGEGDGSPWALNLNHPCSWGSYAESPRRPGSWGPLASLGGAFPTVVDQPRGTVCSSQPLASAPDVLRTRSPASVSLPQGPLVNLAPRGVSPRAHGGQSGVEKARTSTDARLGPPSPRSS